MDYTAQIQSKLHGHYSGLKKDPGLAWLNNALNQLDRAGLGQLVGAFTSDMGNFGKAGGFLLEIQTAQAAIAAYPNAKPSYERKEGVAQTPCDITLEASGFRTDFQCKAMQNFYNEKFTTEFELWVNHSYPDVDPGAIVQFQANTAANEQTFAELRLWFASHCQTWPLWEEQVWSDSQGVGRVWITLLPAIGPGLCAGMTQSPVQTFRFFQKQDNLHIRKRVLQRVEPAKKTFGFSPGASQFNFVVIDAPGLAVTFDEDTLFDALYGDRLAVIDNTGPVRAARITHEANGLFYSGAIDYCSAVLLMDKFRIDADHECIVYPHPKYIQEVKAAWVGRGRFRLPED